MFIAQPKQQKPPMILRGLNDFPDEPFFGSAYRVLFFRISLRSCVGPRFQTKLASVSEG